MRSARVAAVGILAAVCVWVAAPLQAAPAHRFGPSAAAVPLNIGAQVLTAEERAFIAGLPEIRVAVPLPPSQPYEVIGADGQITGIHPEMLLSLGRAFGLKLRPVVLPDWSSVLAAARNKEVDLLMTLGVTTERTDYLAFTLGATPLPGALFARTPASAGVNPPAPPQARFALERAYMTNDFVRRQYPDARILTVETTGEALAAVAEGRADYYLGSLLEAADWLAREPRPGVELHRLQPYGTGYYHFAVRKDWAPLAVILNKGIATLRATPGAGFGITMPALPGHMSLQAPVPLSAAESALLVQRPIWRVGAVRGLAMLNDVDVGGLHTGVAAEYAEQVARRLAIGLELVPFDSVATMLDALRAGHIDIVPFLTRTPERERDFVFSAPYVSMPYMLVARSDSPLYWGLDSLRGRRLALAAQHPLIELLKLRYPDIQVVLTRNGNEAMDAVADGRADAAVEVKLFANLRINGDNDGRLRTVAEVGELPAQFHFAASRQAGPLMPVVDRALADIPAAERERMLRRWVARDFSPAFPWRRYLPLLWVAGAALLTLASATWWWMRRLQREVMQRRRADERLNDIGATLPGVTFRYEVGADHQLQGTWFSPGAQAFLGIELDPTRTILSNLAPRVRPDHLALAERAQAESMQLGGVFKATAAYRHPDGRELWLHAEAVAKTLPGGSTTWTGYVVDVSSERELQARVAREAEARNLLLASASHELRAPTHTLSLALQSLAETGVPGAASAKLQVAQDAARTLSQLLNDVLDAARLDHGELQLRPQAFALHGLVAQVADSTRAWAERKGIVFSAQIDADVPHTVRLDPLRLRQILTNLLSNAVKYTAHGQVSLHVSLRRPADQDPLLVFTVSDTGRGIAASQMERLFAPYATGDAAQAPVPEGSSGLGLNICRRLAGLMGGTVTLSSEPGHGTQARVELPTQWAAPAEGMARASGDAVLVCDDDETSRMLMAHMLVSRGYVVAECGGGEEALRTLREGGIQALITDLDMAGMDGLQLIRLLRQDEAARGVRPLRVVVCSGSPVPVQAPDETHPPFDAWLTKPVDMPVLMGTLDALGVRHTGRLPERATSPVP